MSGMLRVENIEADAKVVCEYKGSIVEFDVEAIINRRIKEKVPENLFYVLNLFLDTETEEFRETYFKRLLKAKNAILLSSNDELKINVKMTHDVLELFSLEKVTKFIYDKLIPRGIIKIPELPDVFDESIEQDGRGSREQTYLKNDYVELIALLTILKSIIGIIGEFATYNDSYLNKNNLKFFTLFKFISTYKPLYHSDPFVKIHDSIIKLIERFLKDKSNTAIQLIEKNLSKDILPEYTISKVIIERMIFNNEVNDTDSVNTITRIYNTAIYRLKLKDAGESKTRLKSFNVTEEGSESESAIESYRVVTNITLGDIEELRLPFLDIERLAKWLSVDDRMDEVYECRESISSFLHNRLPLEESIIICSWLYKEVVDPRAFDYIYIEEIVTAIAVAMVFLRKHGFTFIATIISSFNKGGEELIYNMQHRKKLDQDLKTIINDLFVVNNVINNNTNKTINIVEVSLANIIRDLAGKNLVTLAPTKYVEEVFGVENREVNLTSDIRNILAKFIIFVNRDLVL